MHVNMHVVYNGTWNSSGTIIRLISLRHCLIELPNPSGCIFLLGNMKGNFQSRALIRVYTFWGARMYRSSSLHSHETKGMFVIAGYWMFLQRKSMWWVVPWGDKTPKNPPQPMIYLIISTFFSLACKVHLDLAPAFSWPHVPVVPF